MQREDLKEFLGWFLINLAVFVNSCSIGFLFFVLTYKLHVHFGFPEPSVNGLVLLVCLNSVFFKLKLELELEESELSTKEVLSQTVSRTLFMVCILVVIFNIDTAFSFLQNAIGID